MPDHHGVEGLEPLEVGPGQAGDPGQGGDHVLAEQVAHVVGVPAAVELIGQLPLEGDQLGLLGRRAGDGTRPAPGPRGPGRSGCRARLLGDVPHLPDVGRCRGPGVAELVPSPSVDEDRRSRPGPTGRPPRHGGPPGVSRSTAPAPARGAGPRSWSWWMIARHRLHRGHRSVGGGHGAGEADRGHQGDAGQSTHQDRVARCPLPCRVSPEPPGSAPRWPRRWGCARRTGRGRPARSARPGSPPRPPPARPVARPGHQLGRAAGGPGPSWSRSGPPGPPARPARTARSAR